jgi:glycosyltransferase involved in cell wall biosynthesis
MTKILDQASPLLLSVLIPTRNRGEYLRFAIQSALNIKSLDIEVIVSENFGSDDGWEVANSFKDPRLKVIRPDKPLPMHENFELLLERAKGLWITFIGDDDAIMPHSVDYLTYITAKYPECEAIVTPRAYYFWESAYQDNEPPSCNFSFSHKENWRDSKEELKKCLDGLINYIDLPQIYSGGFQHRSLVKRVTHLQGGKYFRSVTPDAYSAVMGVLHTYRYLEVGVPLTWIGTSPNSDHKGKKSTAKNRYDDFFGMESEASLVMNRCLGKEYKKWAFLLYFYESYLAAAPFTSVQELSYSQIQRISNLCSKSLVIKGDVEGAMVIAKSLGVRPLSTKKVNRLIRRGTSQWPYWTLNKILSKLQRLCREIIPLSVLQEQNATFYIERKLAGDDCPNILSSNTVLNETYYTYKQRLNPASD